MGSRIFYVSSNEERKGGDTMKKLLTKVADWVLYDDSYVLAVVAACIAAIASVAVMALT